MGVKSGYSMLPREVTWNKEAALLFVGEHSLELVFIVLIVLIVVVVVVVIIILKTITATIIIMVEVIVKHAFIAVLLVINISYS